MVMGYETPMTNPMPVGPIYPFTNELLAKSQDFRDSDAFFMTAKVEQFLGQPHIRLDRNLPLLVNDVEMQQKIQDQYSLTLLLRNDFSNRVLQPSLFPQFNKHEFNKHAPKVEPAGYQDVYTVGTGIGLWLRDDWGQKIMLAQNSLDKKVNPGAYNFTASGLISGANPFEQAAREFYEETAIFLKDPDDHFTLHGLMIKPPHPLNVLDLSMEDYTELYADPRYDVIGNDLERQGLWFEEGGKNIRWRSVSAGLVCDQGTDSACITSLHERFNVLAHVAVDEDKRSVNVHYILEADLRRHLNGAKMEDRLVFADPEGYGKKHSLFTAEEALSQISDPAYNLVPACADYIRRMAGFNPG